MYTKFGGLFSAISSGNAADLIVFSSAFLTRQDQKALQDRAIRAAKLHGISERRWLKWRAGFGVCRDLLMILDPEREVQRINGKHGSVGRVNRPADAQNRHGLEHD